MRTTFGPDHRNAPRDEVAVVLAGEIDLATAPGILAAIMETVRDEPGTVVVDMAAVTFMDSSGAHMLVQAQAAADDHGVAFAILNSSEACRVVLEVSGLDEMLLARR